MVAPTNLNLLCVRFAVRPKMAWLAPIPGTPDTDRAPSFAGARIPGTPDTDRAPSFEIDYDRIIIEHPCAYCVHERPYDPILLNSLPYRPISTLGLHERPAELLNSITWTQRASILRDGRYCSRGYFYCRECWLWWEDEYKQHWQRWIFLCISFAQQQPTRELVGYLHTLELT
jgi:hypothetical protein